MDKFQSQEAPVATSRTEDASRGMDVPERRDEAVVVANPALLKPACTYGALDVAGERVRDGGGGDVYLRITS